MSSIMNTPENIIRKYTEKFHHDGKYEFIHVKVDKAILAMEEYSKQQNKEIDRLTDALKKIRDGRLTDRFEDRLSDIEMSRIAQQALFTKNNL